jgi:hypothetical protein
MKQFFALLLTLFVALPTMADTFGGHYVKVPYIQTATEELKVGEYYVEVTVVFSTDKYSLQSCAKSKNENLRTGFHVGQREDNKRIHIYCGVEEIGKTFNIIDAKGI